MKQKRSSAKQSIILNVALYNFSTDSVNYHMCFPVQYSEEEELKKTKALNLAT
jgi:hypothetical protein